MRHLSQKVCRHGNTLGLEYRRVQIPQCRSWESAVQDLALLLPPPPPDGKAGWEWMWRWAGSWTGQEFEGAGVRGCGVVGAEAGGTL